MNYEQKYNEALERAQKATRAGGDVAMDIIQYIFPELAESEDERMCTRCIELLRKVSAYSGEEYIGVEIVDCIIGLQALRKKLKEPHIPWYDLQKSKEAGYTILKTEEYEELIKQKEQKPALTPERIHPKFAVGDTVCRPMWSDHTIREIYVRCNDSEYVCVNEEGTESHISFSEQDEWERKEQKPFDDTQEYLKGVDRVQNYEELTKFEKGFDRIADTYAHRKNKEGYNKPWYTKERAAEMLYWAKEELGLLNVQKPAEWSEEDETRLKVIKKELERFIMLKQYETPLSVDDISWLELLPERFSLQPKQEWSDEDKKMLRSCCAAIIYDNSFTYDERYAMEDWLKGRFNLLCPVKQEWSEEDIENGSYISAFLQANCENNEILKKATTWFMSRFKSLYPVKQEWSDEDAEKAAREYADENPGMMHENDGSVVDDYDTPYYNFLAGYRWTKSHIHPVNTIEHGEEDTKIRTCDKLEMEKLYGEEY